MKNFFANLQRAMQRFMMGRYGTDKLNLTILAVGTGLCFLMLLIRVPMMDLVLMVLAYGLMFWAIFRMLSRNTYKRYLENKKFLQFWERCTDRRNRYFSCPRCRQPVRVPRGKGKVAITCPKCRERFIKKT